MNPIRICTAGALAFALISAPASAADYPAPKEGDWVALDFRFHTGEIMPELRLHYRTVGNPSGEPVLILHGTGGSGANFLTPAFAGELFGSGQPLECEQILHHPVRRDWNREIGQAVGRPADEISEVQLR